MSPSTTLLSLTPGSFTPNFQPLKLFPLDSLALTFNHNCRTARNSRPLEVIGTYDPVPKADPYAPVDSDAPLHKDIKLDTDRAKYWVGVGAQPTDTAWRLLHMAGVLPKHKKANKIGTLEAVERDQVQRKFKVEDVKIR